MGSMSVSSCRCCMFVSCVHPAAVLNAAFCSVVIFMSRLVLYSAGSVVNRVQVVLSGFSVRLFSFVQAKT